MQNETLTILELYKQRNADSVWYEKHFSLADGNFGKMFDYTNTNFRTQDTFTKSFLAFLEIENIPREDWPKHQNHGQEEHKHYVIPMLQSKLFKRGSSEIFSRTMKGFLYNDFLKLDLRDSEKWFLNYIFLLNGYYSNKRNYIASRVNEELMGYFLSVDGVTQDSIIEMAKILVSEKEIDKIIRTDFFYFHSFYDDVDFLSLYMCSSFQDKEELAAYIESNLKNADFKCCLSRKYRTGGNFYPKMIIDETKVFLLTLCFVREKDLGIKDIYKVLFNFYNENIDHLSNEILNYLYVNKTIFEPIIRDIIGQDGVESGIEATSVIDEIKASVLSSIEDKPEDYIDETDNQGSLRIKAIFNLRKKQALMLSDYKCALEKHDNCSLVYFTAKATGKNYLELHHFIPQEFRNDFSKSIEVLANYVTLCPRCHRKIHLALDRERQSLITWLYNNRIDRLKVVGLQLDLEKVLEYYKIR